MQCFCGILVKPTEAIKDTNLPSYWRGYIGEHADIPYMKQIFARYWKPAITDTHFSSEDATCYESRMSYPTPVKLLWDCCNKTYLSYNSIRKSLKLRLSRCNYEARRKKFLNYQKTYKKIAQIFIDFTWPSSFNSYNKKNRFI
jgi:hypothetical protein